MWGNRTHVYISPRPPIPQHNYSNIPKSWWENFCGKGGLSFMTFMVHMYVYSYMGLSCPDKSKNLELKLHVESLRP